MIPSHTSSSALHPITPTSATVFDYICLYTHDLKRKQKRWQDGRLKYHTFNKRIMVYDERGSLVGDAHWRLDYDLDEGEEIELERGGVIVQVSNCVGQREQDISEVVKKRNKDIDRQNASTAQSSIQNHQSTPRTQPPSHFQLRHRPLNELITSPGQGIGRASVPSISPFEERQIQSGGNRINDSQPAKRRRVEISPPSKQGYAQSLFGVTLTLSARPVSTPASVRNLSQISAHLVVEQGGGGNCGGDGTISNNKASRPALSRLSNAPVPRQPQPQPQPPIKKSGGSPQTDRSATINLVSMKEQPQNHRNQISEEAVARKSRTKNSFPAIHSLLTDDTENSVLNPVDSVISPAVQSFHVPLSHYDLTLESRGRKPASLKPTPDKHVNSDSRKLDHQKIKPGGATANAQSAQSEKKLAEKLHPMLGVVCGERGREKRTELRIKARRKRGLLSITEKATPPEVAHDAAKTEASSNQPTLSHPTGNGKSEDSGTTAHSQGHNYEELARRRHGLLAPSDPPASPPLTGPPRPPRPVASSSSSSSSSSPTNDKGGFESHAQHSVVTRAPPTDSDDPEQKESERLSAMPRLASLGRRNVKSKEIIGYPGSARHTKSQGTKTLGVPDDSSMPDAHRQELPACRITHNIKSIPPPDAKRGQQVGLKTGLDSRSRMETLVLKPTKSKSHMQHMDKIAKKTQPLALSRESSSERSGGSSAGGIRGHDEHETKPKPAPDVAAISRPAMNGGPWSREAYDLLANPRPR
jgi:hypothetical protein